MDSLREKVPALFTLPTHMPDIARHMKRADEGYTSTDIFQQIVTQVKDFEGKVDEQHEVGILLASFGNAVTLQVRQISCMHPALIIFEGVLDDGTEGRLIQHSSQLNFLLTKLSRAHPEEPRRAIGFGTWQ